MSKKYESLYQKSKTQDRKTAFAFFKLPRVERVGDGQNPNFWLPFYPLADLAQVEPWQSNEMVDGERKFPKGNLEILSSYLNFTFMRLQEENKILFSGDGIIQHLWLQLDESLPVRTQIQSMERMLPLRNTFDTVLNGHIQTPYGAELFDTLLEALKDLEAGNTAGDIDYEWLGNVSKAHPYQPEDRRIVYKEK